jgi:hypothetical protein
MPLAEADLRQTADIEPVDLTFALEPIKYSRPVRLAIIFGSAALLWAVLIAGGWGLYSLIA